MTKADIDDCRPCSDVPEEYPGNRLRYTPCEPVAGSGCLRSIRDADPKKLAIFRPTP